MAEVKKVTLKRFNGTDNDDLYPTTDWDQIEDKPTTFTPTAHTLNSHSDVNASAPTDGQVLAWDNDNQQWIASTSAGGGGVDKADLQNLYVYGKASAAITIGQAIQFAGAQGDHILIKPAVQSEINANPNFIIGIAETNLAINEFGYVIVNGRLNLDTSVWEAGDILYFDSTGTTPGALTITEPGDPNACIEMAAVSIDGVGTGEFVVRTTILTRTIDEVTGLQNALDGKSDVGHTHDDRYYTETETDTLLSGKSDTGHTHDDRYYTETETDSLLSGKSDTGHTHDDRYYTETELDAGQLDNRYYTETETNTLLSGKSDTGHTHDDRYYTETETNSLLSAKSDTGHTHDDRYYTETETNSLLSGKSDTTHIHDDRYYTETETNTLLSGKENAFSKNTAFNKNFGTTSGTVAEGNHTHAQYAPLASPVFTGNPTAPTPTAGDSDTTLATTAFVSTAISNLVNGASASFDTLKEIQDAMATDTELANAIAGLTIGDGTQTVSAGSGLTGGGSFTANQTGNSTVTVSHADTSSQASVNNTGRTYIQDITLDTYGHITGIASATETVSQYSHPTYPGDDIDLDTGPLTGATVISDLDFNITSDTLGHITDANATYSTRNLTASDVGASPAGHTHDDRYFTETEVNNKTFLKSNTDNRAVATIPNNYNGIFDIKGLKTNTAIGITDGATYSALLGIRGWADSSGGNAHEIAFDGNGTLYHRHGASTSWNAWQKIYKDDYHPTADTWTTARTLTVGNTGKSVNGSGNVSWSLAEIGAYAATNPSGYTTNTGTVTSVATGGGLTGGTITTSGTISHADTSAQASVNNSGATVIQDVTLDTYGHTTGLASVTITPALIGAQPAGTYDNYSSWTLQAQNSAGTSLGSSAITSGDTAVIKAGSNVTLSWADDTVTINSTDTNTTYSAGTGISFSGTQINNSAPDQTVSLTGSGATTVTGTYPNFTISSTDTDTNTTYSAGSGLSLVGTTFSHSDTSTQASINNSGATFIQDITLDTYGHITSLGSATYVPPVSSVNGFTGAVSTESITTSSAIVNSVTYNRIYGIAIQDSVATRMRISTGFINPTGASSNSISFNTTFAQPPMVTVFQLKASSTTDTVVGAKATAVTTTGATITMSFTNALTDGYTPSGQTYGWIAIGV